jgi:hypothetical protein
MSSRLPLLAALAVSLCGCLPGERRAQSGPLQAGMSREQVIVGWGPPESMSRATSELGENEQWLYSDGRSADFSNGVLTSFQGPESPRK